MPLDTTQIDYSGLLRLLPTILKAVLSLWQTTDPRALILIQLAQSLLDRFNVQHVGAGMFRAQARPQQQCAIPPEHTWDSPDLLLEWTTSHLPPAVS